jgi:GNAT superfamily N-acetyltransferase
MSIADTAALQELSTPPGFMWGTAQIPSKTLEQRQRQVESMVTNRNTHALVAELDGKVVADATLHVGNGKRRHSGDVGIGVHDEYVGRGIGGALMEALLDLADNYLGLKRVELDVIVDNERAAGIRLDLGEPLLDLVIVRLAALDDRRRAMADGHILHAPGRASVDGVAGSLPIFGLSAGAGTGGCDDLRGLRRWWRRGSVWHGRSSSAGWIALRASTGWLILFPKSPRRKRGRRSACGEERVEGAVSHQLSAVSIRHSDWRH